MTTTQMTTRKERHEEWLINFLQGRARSPYKHTPVFNPEDQCTCDSSDVDVCAQCRPILVRYADPFKTMVHQGTALKKRKHTNPNPKRSGSIPYRDVKQQNEWLQSNVFDSMGNYLYCCACICAAFGISKQRLARQRKIKGQQSQHPIVEMSKAQVEEKSLGKYVIMPDSLESSFKTWWQSLPELAVISVRYPYTRHGNTGKPSNSTVLNDFLAFVDANSQPNGRSGDSSGPTHYFVSKFATVQAPKPGYHHYEERLKRSVVGEFNRTQREAGRDTCSNASSHNWLKNYRPKLSICPHQENYCDTCSKLKEGIRGKQTTINRLLASASSEISFLENDKMALNQALEDHRHKTSEAHKYYVDTTKLCAEEWAEIADLQGRSLSPEENERLTTMKRKFSVVLSADYQMSKLVPYWGASSQPGSTYYLQKLSHDIYGIINHATNDSKVYLFDEREGPKNTDHTISYTAHYISTLPSWVRRVHLFLDNTCSTNKNAYLMGWAWETVEQGHLDLLRISFLIAGHTKLNYSRELPRRTTAVMSFRPSN